MTTRQQRVPRAGMSRLKQASRILLRSTLFLSVVAFVTAAATVGQTDSTCSYQTCALRVKSTFLSRRLVRGAQEEKVVGFGLLAPDLSTLVNPDGTPNPHFAGYKGHADKSIIGTTLFAAALLAGTLVFPNNETVGLGLTVGSLGFLSFSIVHGIRAQEDLSRGVWLYNERLAAADARKP